MEKTFFQHKIPLDFIAPILLAWNGITENVNHPQDFSKIKSDLINKLNSTNKIFEIYSKDSSPGMIKSYVPEELLQEVADWCWQNDNPVLKDGTVDLSNFSIRAKEILSNAQTYKFYCTAHDKNGGLWIGWSETPFILKHNQKLGYDYIQNVQGNFAMWNETDDYIGSSAARYAAEAHLYESNVTDKPYSPYYVCLDHFPMPDEAVYNLMYNPSDLEKYEGKSLMPVNLNWNKGTQKAAQLSTEASKAQITNLTAHPKKPLAKPMIMSAPMTQKVTKVPQEVTTKKTLRVRYPADAILPTLLAWCGIIKDPTNEGTFNKLLEEVKTYLTMKGHISQGQISVILTEVDEANSRPHICETALQDIINYLWSYGVLTDGVYLPAGLKPQTYEVFETFKKDKYYGYGTHIIGAENERFSNEIVLFHSYYADTADVHVEKKTDYEILVSTPETALGCQCPDVSNRPFENYPTPVKLQLGSTHVFERGVNDTLRTTIPVTMEMVARNNEKPETIIIDPKTTTFVEHSNIKYYVYNPTWVDNGNQALAQTPGVVPTPEFKPDEDPNLKFNATKAVPILLAWCGITQNNKTAEDFKDVVKRLTLHLISCGFIRNNQITITNEPGVDTDHIKTYFEEVLLQNVINWLQSVGILVNAKIVLPEEADPVLTEKLQNVRTHAYYGYGKTIANEEPFSNEWVLFYSEVPAVISVKELGETIIPNPANATVTIVGATGNKPSQATPTYFQIGTVKLYGAGSNPNIQATVGVNVGKAARWGEKPETIIVDKNATIVLQKENKNYYSFDPNWKIGKTQLEAQTPGEKDLTTPDPEAPELQHPDKYLIKNSTLEMLADYLRAKSGIKERLSMPAGFFKAIDKLTESTLPPAEGIKI